tara:strand:+ start:1058 stop:1570 length:513 start_codon:yes stop_codon:yes gene_type:complete
MNCKAIFLEMVNSYNKIFGSGITGIAITILIWIICIKISTFFSIPEMGISPLFRKILIILFSIDSSILIVWSLMVLPIGDRGNKFISNGPYQYVRHPFYAAFIWSGTGIISMIYKSWLLLIFIIPIHIFWVWHIQKEEKLLLNQFGYEYEQYMMKTPQFFPRYISSKEVE